jgi:glucose dehydrogenase
VQRNQRWFQDNISTLQQVWKTIEYERAHGFQHRAPVKRMAAAANKTNNYSENAGQSGCLISLDKETGQVSVNSGSPHPTPSILAIDLKIRTESFDDTKEKMSSIVGLNISE